MLVLSLTCTAYVFFSATQRLRHRTSLLLKSSLLPGQRQVSLHHPELHPLRASPLTLSAHLSLSLPPTPSNPLFLYSFGKEYSRIQRRVHLYSLSGFYRHTRISVVVSDNYGVPCPLRVRTHLLVRTIPDFVLPTRTLSFSTFDCCARCRCRRCLRQGAPALFSLGLFVFRFLYVYVA